MNIGSRPGLAMQRKTVRENSMKKVNNFNRTELAKIISLKI
jgi:hypothetical protein